MARTQAADYEERREAIVERAADLFASRGFLGASVSDIAKACKTSKSLLYHYYPSKEDVLYAVMLSHVDRLVDDVDEALARPGDAGEKLRVLLTLFMRHYVGAAARQKVLLNDLDNLPADKRAAIVAKQRQLVDAAQALITEIDPRLAEDKTKARAKTMLLFGMINWTGHWYDASGPIKPDAIADMAYDMVAG
ncbi:MAG: TetR/AcrR family transcriptional regulator [Sphingobium sp.]|jgi:AcrR family transcriptional regulator|nr:TetR/AcrR family transcriptional regulator [Sphingobium sp.]MCI1271718.1 TetR/AcrR family transcriptional regulator [Sphingobium sp.]MCI1756119.1 TetR/AcrR family transcriptional regulator [Sphingobium sp.]MCI2053558.1 TetR/AcrR family transcriptional regulator [Sphingobium sp.]